MRRMPDDRSSRFARPRMAIASSRRQAPTGSMLTAASLASGRLANARSANSCSPAGVAASVSAVHLRRKNRMRNTSHGSATNRIGGAATAIPSTTANQVAVLPWLVLRIRFFRRKWTALTLAATPAGEQLLALRALANRPLAKLAAVSIDPVGAWRRADAIAIRGLANLELRSSGIRRK